MKTKRLLFPVISGISFVTVVTLSAFSLSNNQNHGYHGWGGNASSCGSPGELGTCTRSGCHGSGATPPGLPDNAGPGSLTLSSVPAMVGNQYVPGTVYNMSVTVAQTGVKRFGFACEILDNSGSNNGHINNTAGTVTVTDHINTRTWQAYGNGRLSITQDTMGGYATNTYSFHFNWTAPNSGFGNVNVYLCGNATNLDTLADAGDDIYSQHIVLTEGVLGINTPATDALGIKVYPVPATNQITLTLDAAHEESMGATLYSLDGRLIKELEKTNIALGSFSKTYAVNDLSKGIYLLKVYAGDDSYVKKVIIE